MRRYVLLPWKVPDFLLDWDLKTMLPAQLALLPGVNKTPVFMLSWVRVSNRAVAFGTAQ
jgi:hypothetical protein